MKTSNELAKTIHEGNVKRGFWEGERRLTEVLMLTVCEIAEAIEADRDGKWVSKLALERYLNSPTPDVFRETIKDTVQDEIADAYIRIYDFSHKFRYNLDGIEYFMRSNGKIKKITEDSKFVDDCFLASSYIFTISDYNEVALPTALCALDKICKKYNINIDFHIHAKLAYNESRPYKHGKNY